MRAFGCLLVLIVAAAIGLYIYRTALTGSTVEGMPPEQQINTVGVQMDLQAIARAERVYLVTHGRYGTIDDLVADQAIPFSGQNRHGYNYTAECDGDRHFKVTARPADPARTSWPSFTVSENMQVVREP